MRKSSYQKLKEENLLLRQKINTLVMFPNSQDAIMIQMVHKSNRQVEEQLMNGTPLNYAGGTFGYGIISQIK